MYGRISLQDNISIGEAFRHINEAIEQHQTCIEQHRATILALKSQIAELEAKTRLHQTSVLALKSQSNDYAPISRLPPEVLCQIFSFAQRDDDARMLPYSAWTALTQVIRRWRNVAINSSTLWTEPHFGNERWCEEAFRRSKDAGLVINILGSAQEHREAVEFALRHSAHIRGLYIYDTKDVGHSVWTRLCYELVKTAPRLEFLHLTFVSASEFPQTFGAINEPSCVPENVLKDKLQRLRSLELICYDNWNPPRVFHHAVVHLTINDSNPTRQQFVLAMKEMPYLEYLHLAYALPMAAHQPDSFSAGNSIYLSRLRGLHVITEVSQKIEAFFQLVTIPPDAAVRVDCFTEKLSSIECTNVILAISRSYSNTLRCPRFRTLDLQHSWFNEYLSGDLQLRFYSDPFPDNKIIDRCSAETNIDVPNFNLDLYFQWKSQKPLKTFLDMNLVMQSIFSVFPLMHIQQIHLDLPDLLCKDEDLVFANPDILLNTFGKLPELRTCVIGPYACKIFIDALELSLNLQDTVSPGSIKHIYFPKLCSIFLHNPRIANGKSAPNPIAVEIGLLQNCLIRRCKNNAEIQNCRFIGFYGLGPWMSAETLEEMVFDGVRNAIGCIRSLPDSSDSLHRNQLEEQGNKGNEVFLY